MHKRTSYEIIDKIFSVVKEKPESYVVLERKINTGFRTVKENCENLARLGLLKIDTIAEDPSNGRLSYRISITEEGIKAMKHAKDHGKK